jgi:hypothetical protein
MPTTIVSHIFAFSPFAPSSFAALFAVPSTWKRREIPVGQVVDTVVLQPFSLISTPRASRI